MRIRITQNDLLLMLEEWFGRNFSRAEGIIIEKSSRGDTEILITLNPVEKGE